MSFGFGFALPAYPLRGGAGNNPFNQDGPTLDLSFVGTAGNLSGADTYTLNTDFITPQYQIAAQYVVWETGVGLVDKTFSQIITFTRASTATYFDATGTLQSAAIDAPRFDYNPATLAAQGLLIEEQRTNSIRNNTMQGAVAGTPGTLPTNWSAGGLGTLTQTVVGTGTQNGINYVDVRFNGTTSTTQLTLRFEPNGAGSIPAANGQTWAGSVWTAVVAGSTTNIISRQYSCNLWDAGSGFVGGVIGFTYNASSTLTRSSGSGTIAVASTAFIQPQIYLTFSSGVAIDITLRIGLPQLEQGAFATSVIPTTTTALTRSADVASVNTLSPWYNASASTIYAEWSRDAVVPSGVFPRAVDLIESATTQKISINHLDNQTSTTSQPLYPSGLSWPFTSVLVNPTVGVKTALAFQVGSGRYAVNGSLGGADFSVASIPAFDQLILGAGKGFLNNTRLNGYLRRITYYPRRLSNAELQAITA